MRDIQNGRWHEVKNEEEFKNLIKYGHVNPDGRWDAQIRLGTYDGPKKYYVLSYSQPCPRGCCTDSVYEAINREQVEYEVEREIEDLKEILEE